MKNDVECTQCGKKLKNMRFPFGKTPPIVCENCYDDRHYSRSKSLKKALIITLTDEDG